MRSQPKLFISDACINGKYPQKVLALLQDIEAAWRRLERSLLARQQLFSLFEKLALPFEHQVSEQTAELITGLLQHANKKSLSAKQRLSLMHWTDELLEQLEYSNFLAPQLDIVALREQFFNCYDDEWLTYEQFIGDELESDEPHLLSAASPADHSPVDHFQDDYCGPFTTLQLPQVQRTMAQQLAAITPCQTNYGEGTQQQVKEMLLACYQQLLQNLLPAECLKPLVELLATYRQQLDRLNSQLADSENPEGWVLSRFGHLNKALQQPAIAQYVEQLELELTGLRELLPYCKTIKQLKPLLDEDAYMVGDFDIDFDSTPGMQKPGTYH